MSSTKIVFFGPIGKTRWPPWPLIGWDIFDFFSETTERNSTKLDRKQDLKVLYKVYVLWADRKNKMAALASDWLRHFQLLLWNRWTEFNETWQEARSQYSLISFCFRTDRKNKLATLASDWPKLFFSFPLKRLNGIQRNLTGSKISTSSTMFVIFWQIEKTRWPPWCLIGWDIFNFFSETDKRNSKKLKLEARCQCLLRSLKWKLPPWLICQKRWHIVLRCTICGPLGLLLSVRGGSVEYHALLFM